MKEQYTLLSGTKKEHDALAKLLEQCRYVPPRGAVQLVKGGTVDNGIVTLTHEAGRRRLRNAADALGIKYAAGVDKKRAKDGDAGH